MKDSAGAKLAVVLGVGAVAVGLGMLRTRLAGPPAHEQGKVVASSAIPVPAEPKPAVPTPSGDKPAADPRPTGPTQADRVAMLEACSDGDQAKVEALVLKGVNLDGTLGNAAKSGKAPLVAWLIDHGVSAKEDEDLSVPPILMADEHDAVVTTLLAKGAHEPTLAKAVAAGAPKAVARLLGKGASATSKNAEGEPVLLIALRNATGEKRRLMVDALLKAGADVNTKSDDDTPLSVALAAVAAHSDGDAKPGDRAVDLVGKLVAKGAKVDGDALVTAMGIDDDRRAALLDALLAGKLEPSATLRAATFAADSHDAASLKRLATKGIAWSTIDAHATPPLATAIFGSDVAMVTALIEAGAPIDQMGEHGDTGLLAAVAAAAGESDEAVRVVRVLLDHGANANKRGRDGRTALFAASQQGTESLVALLVSKGARVDDAVDGMTPLEAADARGHDGVVKLLKARGAKVKKPAKD